MTPHSSNAAEVAFAALPLQYGNMDKDFTHLLLTRFNTAIGFAPSRMGLQTEWLKSRLALFEQYCLPSIASQQRAAFQWLVFFDAESPDWFRDKIAAYGPIIRPIYIEGVATDQVIAESIAAAGVVNTRYLVTTRVDNDDALAKGHLARVQGAFSRQQREFIEFPFGLQSYRDCLYSVYWPSNPFLSLIEEVQAGGRFTTVLCVPHDRVREAGPVKQIRCTAQWLQVLHSTNLLNGLRGWPRLRSHKHADFALHWPSPAQPDSVVARMRFSAEAYGARANKLAGKLAAKLGR